MGVTTRTYKNAAGSTGTRLAVENGGQQDAGGVALFAADGTLLIGPKTKANSLPVVQASDWTTELGTTAQVTLQSAATGNGAGAAAAAGGYATAVFNVRGLPGATINFELTNDGGANWDSLSVTQMGTGVIGSTTTANGYYRATIAGLDLTNGKIQARISGYSAGTITVTVTLSTVVAANKYMALLQLPTALAANGGLKVEGIVGGVAQPVSLAAAETHLGEVGGNSAVLPLTFTVSTSPAYSSGDVLGGKLTIANAFRASGKTAVLQDLYLADNANQKPTGSLLFFNADPAAATTTDNSAFAYSTDFTKQCGRVDVASSDWSTIGGKATLHNKNIGAVLSAASGTTLYAVFVTTSTPTYAATTDLTGAIGLLRD